MSDLNSVIVDIVSLLNNKYGTDISAEDHLVNAYTPTNDEKKEEFTDEDIKWLLQQVKSLSFSGGVKGLVKRMGDKFNNSLKQTIYDASRVHGDLEGVVKFLSNYDKLKDKLPRGKSPENRSRSQAPDMDIEDPNKLKLKGESIKSNIRKVRDYLKTVKEKHPKEYEGSFYSHTDSVLSKLMQYLNSSAKSTKLENDFIQLFVTDEIDDAYGLLKGWKKLKVKGVTPAVEDIFLKIENYFDKPKPKGEQEQLNPEKVDIESLTKLEKEVHTLEKKRPSVEDPEKLVNKEVKKERNKDIREVVKDVDSDDKHSYSLNIVNEYLNKAKKSYPDSFDQHSLHKYTKDLVNAMEAYLKGEGRDEELNRGIKNIFNDTPGILKIWEELNKPFSKRLKQYSSAFNSLANPSKEHAGKEVNKSTISEIETLANKANVQVTDKDKTMAKGLSGKKERTKLVLPKDIDTDMYNKVLKHLVKNIENLPKTPKKKDFVEMVPDEMEKKLFENETLVTFFSKVLNFIDDIKNENDEISDADLVSEVKKLIEESDKPKPDERKVMLDRDIPKEQEKEKKTRGEEPTFKKKKESSTNIVNDYMGTLFYKLDKLANNSPDKLVKAELESIAEDIKQLF